MCCLQISSKLYVYISLHKSAKMYLQILVQGCHFVVSLSFRTMTLPYVRILDTPCSDLKFHSWLPMLLFPHAQIKLRTDRNQLSSQCLEPVFAAAISLPHSAQLYQSSVTILMLLFPEPLSVFRTLQDSVGN